MSRRAGEKRKYRVTNVCAWGHSPGLPQTGEEVCSCWSFGNGNVDSLNLFAKAGYEAPIQDGVGYESESRRICNMTGGPWEPLPHPIIIDSGAVASVMPPMWCTHVDVTEICVLRKGEYNIAASGGNVFNNGDAAATKMS